MEEKLYYKDAYVKSAGAKIVKIEQSKIYLDKTIFFAFSGGQASDRGTIDGEQLIDCIKENGETAHLVEHPEKFKAGDNVELKLDWERRYKLMRLHSALHLVYFAFLEKSGVGKDSVIGSNVEPEKARIDYGMEENVNKYLAEVENEVNEIIKRNLKIETYWKEGEEGRREWKCGEWKMDCGGTHPHSTGEIGEVKLKRKNLGKGKERIEVTLRQTQ